MVDLATRCMMGQKLKDLGYPSGLWSPLSFEKGEVIAAEEIPSKPLQVPFFAVKAPVFSFQKLGKVEPSLGPEMKSTGEIMGIDPTFEGALYKAMIASGINFKGDGAVLLTVKSDDKDDALKIGQELLANGKQILATPGTAKYLQENGVDCEPVGKIQHGSPNILDAIMAGRVSLMINTPSLTETSESEAALIRRTCIETGVPCVTSIDTANALVRALVIFSDPSKASCVRLQEYFVPR
jgi:carbamoyl-phosphate synthase large subunit